MSDELVKRKWCYVQSPSDYEIGPCPCGNHNTQWSEWQKHLWCDVCKKDFISESNGVFDGPILVEVCRMMGISFDRINLETETLEVLNAETGEYETKEIPKHE